MCGAPCLPPRSNPWPDFLKPNDRSTRQLVLGTIVDFFSDVRIPGKNLPIREKTSRAPARGSRHGLSRGDVVSRNGRHKGNGHANGAAMANSASKKLSYKKELCRLQIELVKLQEWIRHEGLRVIVLFEGRDAAGKGGAIKRITETLNPRICRVVALGTPTEREKSQWYFQRYVAQLPSAGEMVLFDRSWYNRAGVERVMGFCTEAQYQEFMHSCPEFERMLIRSGIILIKYWFSVSDDEQERRFRERIENPTKRWKLSAMDLESRRHWADYSRAKDEMFAMTDTRQAPWFVVDADNKKSARLNVIHHLLSRIDYKELIPEKLKLPDLDRRKYTRPPIHEQNFIPAVYS
jgi:polyphosphate kinase